MPAQPERLEAEPGSRLEWLLSAYEPAQAAFEEAQARFEAIKTALKNEGAQLSALHGGAVTRITISGKPALPSLTVSWVVQRRLDSAKIREDLPDLYDKYAVRKGHWEIRKN